MQPLPLMMQGMRNRAGTHIPSMSCEPVDQFALDAEPFKLHASETDNPGACLMRYDKLELTRSEARFAERLSDRR